MVSTVTSSSSLIWCVRYVPFYGLPPGGLPVRCPRVVVVISDLSLVVTVQPCLQYLPVTCLGRPVEWRRCDSPSHHHPYCRTVDARRLLISFPFAHHAPLAHASLFAFASTRLHASQCRTSFVSVLRREVRNKGRGQRSIARAAKTCERQ